MKYLIIFLLAIYSVKSDIIINEFFPAPADDEPEWIELYNCSNEIIPIDTFYIYDSGNTKYTVTIGLVANQFCIITKDTSKLKFHRYLPTECSLIQAKLPAFNNTTDQIRLKDKNLITLDSLYYDLKWGKKGISFERIDCSKPAIYSDNLISSQSKDSATCGYLNSNSKTANDLLIENISVDKSIITFYIKNAGMNTFENIQYRILIPLDTNNTFTDSIKVLYPNETYKVSYDTKSFKDKNGIEGEINLLLEILNSDDRTDNSFAYANVCIPYDFMDLSFNEILFDNDDSMSEFLELYNRTNKEINLKNWRIVDYSSTKPDTFLIASKNQTIKQNDYCIAISDTAILEQFTNLKNTDKVFILNKKIQLANTGDKLKLIDPSGEIIDSVEYSDDWQDKTLFPLKNRSIEKFRVNDISSDGKNWKSCLDDALSTPSAQNSTFNEPVKSIEVSFEYNPISKSKNPNTKISVNSIYKTAYLSCKILDIDGRELSEIENLRAVGVAFTLDISSQIVNLPIAPYIILIELTDAETGDYLSQKELFVIGE